MSARDLKDRVIGGVEIERDPPRPPMESRPMAVDDVRGELASHGRQGLHRDLVLEARDRRLRGERVAGDGVAPEQELVDRVVGEPIGVVRIGMPAGEPEDALGQQIRERVPHFPGLPIIDEASGKAID